MRAILAAATLLCVAGAALARDNGQWADVDPDIGAWFARQKQPQTRVSCCGPADAYFADLQVEREGRIYAVITDDRDDEALGRPHVAPGTLVEIPRDKINDPRADPNPTGHGIVFLSSAGGVYCYFNPPGDG